MQKGGKKEREMMLFYLCEKIIFEKKIRIRILRMRKYDIHLFEFISKFAVLKDFVQK